MIYSPTRQWRLSGHPILTYDHPFGPTDPPFLPTMALSPPSSVWRHCQPFQPAAGPGFFMLFCFYELTFFSRFKL